MKDDLISRREALDALEKEKPTPFVNKDGSVDPFGAGQQNQWYRDGITIMNLLPVDSVPVRHGRWRRNKNGTYSCSECQSWIPNEQKYYANFCLYCGARMDGDDAEGIIQKERS